MQDHAADHETRGRMLDLKGLTQLVLLSRSTIYRRVRAKTFPAPIQTSERRIAWMLSDVLQWQQLRPRAIVSPGREAPHPRPHPPARSPARSSHQVRASGRAGSSS
jgi:predicted DNA-binding transcriptional regulator AlpA